MRCCHQPLPFRPRELQGRRWSWGQLWGNYLPDVTGLTDMWTEAVAAHISSNQPGSQDWEWEGDMGASIPISNQEAVCNLCLLAKGKNAFSNRCRRHINHTAEQAKCTGVVGKCKTNHALLRTFCLVLAYFYLVGLWGFWFFFLFVCFWEWGGEYKTRWTCWEGGIGGGKIWSNCIYWTKKIK